MEKGTRLINKLNNKEYVVCGTSVMSNGRKSWECIEFTNNTRVNKEDIEKFYEVVGTNKEVKEIPKFKVDGCKNSNARGVVVYDFNKDTVKVGYTLINGKKIVKTVKKYTYKNGEWAFYINVGRNSICVRDYQLTMTDEWIKEEFKNFKKYKARA